MRKVLYTTAQASLCLLMLLFIAGAVASFWINLSGDIYCGPWPDEELKGNYGQIEIELWKGWAEGRINPEVAYERPVFAGVWCGEIQHNVNGKLNYRVPMWEPILLSAVALLLSPLVTYALKRILSRHCCGYSPAGNIFGHPGMRKEALKTSLINAVQCGACLLMLVCIAAAIVSFWINVSGHIYCGSGPGEEPPKGCYIEIGLDKGWAEGRINPQGSGFEGLAVSGDWWGEIHQNVVGKLNYRVPMWEPIALLSIWPCLHIVGTLRRSRRKRKNRCIDCGYSLTGNTSGVCPECGSVLRNG